MLPERFALVTAKGPVCFNSSSANSFSGTLIPTELGLMVPTPGGNASSTSTTTVNGPGQYNSTTSGICVFILSFLNSAKECTSNETGLSSSLFLILKRFSTAA